MRAIEWSAPGDRASAIELVRLHEPAVVTLDLGLPPDPDGTTEGFATLTEILALKPDTKIIVASGHGARESALKAIALGAYDFYHKPVDIDELGLIVGRAFHVYEIEAENRRLEAAGGGAAALGSLLTGKPGNGQGHSDHRASGKRRCLGDAVGRQRHRQGTAGSCRS